MMIKNETITCMRDEAERIQSAFLEKVAVVKAGSDTQLPSRPPAAPPRMGEFKNYSHLARAISKGGKKISASQLAGMFGNRDIRRGQTFNVDKIRKAIQAGGRGLADDKSLYSGRFGRAGSAMKLNRLSRPAPSRPPAASAASRPITMPGGGPLGGPAQGIAPPFRATSAPKTDMRSARSAAPRPPISTASLETPPAWRATIGQRGTSVPARPPAPPVRNAQRAAPRVKMTASPGIDASRLARAIPKPAPIPAASLGLQGLLQGFRSGASVRRTPAQKNFIQSSMANTRAISRTPANAPLGGPRQSVAGVGAVPPRLGQSARTRPIPLSMESHSPHMAQMRTRKQRVPSVPTPAPTAVATATPKRNFKLPSSLSSYGGKI